MELVLVPVDATTDRSTTATGRPPPAGAGTMPAIGPLAGAVVGRVVTRLADVPDPPLLPGCSTRPAWSDQRIHRLVRLPAWDAAPALRDVLASCHGEIPVPPRRRTCPGPTQRSPGGRLVLEPVADPGPSRPILGILHVHRLGRATPVELTLEPWSAHRSALCLRPRRGRFGIRLPRRYYDVAHRVMDDLWHLIERAAPARSAEETT